MASFIALTVLSILTTTPRLRPSLGAFPTPKILIRSCSSIEATMAQIFVVPMSSPTIMRSVSVMIPSL